MAASQARTLKLRVAVPLRRAVLLLFAVFGAFPLIYTGYISLHKYTLTGTDHGFVGLDNYRRLLGDEHFWIVIGNTFGLFFVATVPQLLLALMVANWLNKQMRARTALRMGVLMPNITSVAAVGIVFGLIFADRLRPGELAAAAASASTRSTGATTAGRRGPRSPSWSTGAGPATTR